MDVLSDIDLGNIFINYLQKKKKKNTINFLTTFYIFHESGIKIFLKIVY